MFLFWESRSRRLGDEVRMGVTTCKILRFTLSSPLILASNWHTDMACPENKGSPGCPLPAIGVNVETSTLVAGRDSCVRYSLESSSVDIHDILMMTLMESMDGMCRKLP